MFGFFVLIKWLLTVTQLLRAYSIQQIVLRAHLKVDVPTAVAGEARTLQFHHRLLVGPLDGKLRQERVPVLLDVSYCGARRRLDLHLNSHQAHRCINTLTRCRLNVIVVAFTALNRV